MLLVAVAVVGPSLLPLIVAPLVDAVPVGPVPVDCGELLAPVEDGIPLPLAVLVEAVAMFVGTLVLVPTMELIWLEKEAPEKRELGFATAADPIEEPRLSAAELGAGV